MQEYSRHGPARCAVWCHPWSSEISPRGKLTDRDRLWMHRGNKACFWIWTSFFQVQMLRSVGSFFQRKLGIIQQDGGCLHQQGLTSWPIRFQGDTAYLLGLQGVRDISETYSSCYLCKHHCSKLPPATKSAVLSLRLKLSVFQFLKVMSINKIEQLSKYRVIMSHGLNLILF